MQYRRLGKSGLKVSALSLGSWVTFGGQIGDDVAEALMIKAYEGGVNFFDNAEGYADGRSEIVMGKVLKKTGWARDTYVVSSKVFFGAAPWGQKRPNQTGLCRKHVFEACDAALQRFQLDYLDLYYCHRPDPETPIEETVFAMNHLIAQGKVFYWGTSEWSVAQIQEAVAIAKANHLIAPTMEQPQYHLFCRGRVEEEYAPLYASANGLGTTIWSPLASGLLTGKYNNGIPADSRMSIEHMGWLRDGLQATLTERLGQIKELAALAKELNVSLPCLAIAWCLANPQVSSVILGASKVSQLEENLKAIDVLPLLTSEVLARMDAIVSKKA
ncbi:MAG: aldo/keto reductase [Verrucomicrobiota bacterium]|nr:aldo/keto reductase [Verrucomicrobiota bacterium]